MFTFGYVAFMLIFCFLFFGALTSLPTSGALFLLSVFTILCLGILIYEAPVAGLVLLAIFLLSIPSMIAACWRKMFPITEEQKNAARLAKNAERRKNYKLKKEAKIAAASKALQPKHIC